MQPKTSTQSLVNTLRQPRARRRALAVLSALGVLVLMGFFAVTNPETLHAHAPLEAADWVGYALCHRITERSFTIAGRQFPLCARCTGMYLGVFLTVVVMALSGRLRYSELPRLPILLVLLGFIAALGIDGLNSYSHFFPNAPHLYEPRNWLRLVTGMGTGVTMGIIILPALAQTLWKDPIRLPILMSWRELVELLTLAAITTALVLSNQPVVLYVLAIASSLGLLFIVSAVIVILVLTLLRRDGRATRWGQTAVPLLGGFCMAVLILSTIGILRFSLTGTMTGIPGFS